MKLEIGHDLHVFNDIFYPGIFVCWLLNSENKQFCDTFFLQQYDFREVKKFQGMKSSSSVALSRAGTSYIQLSLQLSARLPLTANQPLHTYSSE